MNKIKRAIIMASGLGTRLRPLALCFTSEKGRIKNTQKHVGRC